MHQHSQGSVVDRQLPLGTYGHLGVREKALWPQDAEAGSWKPAGLRGSGKT